VPQRANITSVEAIQEFRTQLLVFLSKARPVLDEAGSEVMRVRLWLENDQRTLWEGQLRRRKRKLEEAEAATFGARLSNFQEVSAAQQAALHKARREVSEAEEKLRIIKKWERNFDNQTQPLLKQQEKLTSLLATEIPNALAQLSALMDSLAQYANITPPAVDSAPAPAPLPEKEGQS